MSERHVHHPWHEHECRLPWTFHVPAIEGAPPTIKTGGTNYINKEVYNLFFVAGIKSIITICQNFKLDCFKAITGDRPWQVRATSSVSRIWLIWAGPKVPPSPPQNFRKLRVLAHSLSAKNPPNRPWLLWHVELTSAFPRIILFMQASKYC